MGIYIDVMFNTDGESTSLADMNNDVSSTTGKYTPLKDGRLLKVIIFVGYEAATSLVRDVRIELENSNWEPNRIKMMAQGSGLQTAPSPEPIAYEYVIDQPVKESSSIVGQYIHAGGVPVTSRITVLGVFQA